MELLITLVIALVVIGGILYVVSLLPIDPTIKQIINVVVAIIIVVWVLSLLLGYLPNFPVLRR